MALFNHATWQRVYSQADPRRTNFQEHAASRRYAYVGNDPVDLIDPTGLSPFLGGDAVGQMFGTTATPLQSSFDLSLTPWIPSSAGLGSNFSLDSTSPTVQPATAPITLPTTLPFLFPATTRSSTTQPS